MVDSYLFVVVGVKLLVHTPEMRFACPASAMARGFIPLVGVKLLLESGVIVVEFVEGVSVPKSDCQA